MPSTGKRRSKSDRAAPGRKRGRPEDGVEDSISDIEINDVARNAGLGQNDFSNLYTQLSIGPVDVDNAHATANTTSIPLRAISVLQWWRKSNYSKDATKMEILAALERAGLPKPMELLEAKWGIKLDKTKKMKPQPKPKGATASTSSNVEYSDEDEDEDEYSDEDDDEFSDEDDESDEGSPSLAEKSKKDPHRYYMKPMSKKNRGICYIIDNRKGRRGSKKDADALRKTFTALNFDVPEVALDLTAKDMEKELKYMASSCTKLKPDCFVCCILTHGDSGDRLKGVDGTFLKVDGASNIFDVVHKLFNAASCPSLSGKPKVFFTQACRGRNAYGGATEADIEESPEKHTIPVTADFLFGYSSDRETLSQRDTKKGSWYIQTLTKMIRDHKENDLLTNLTRVSYEISKKENNKHQKQVSSLTSTLRKDLYLAQSD